MDIDISEKKIELIQWLSTVEDATIIDKLMRLRQEETTDWWGSVSKDEQESIEKGVADANNKNLKPHSSARELYKKWL